jgi:hypothetical protein
MIDDNIKFVNLLAVVCLWLLNKENENPLVLTLLRLRAGRTHA